MKKALSIFLITISIFLTMSCMNNSRQNAEMELMKVEVFDDLGNQIEGKWDYRYGYEPMATKPILYHYHVPAVLGESYKIIFYFKSYTNHSMSHYYITYNDNTYECEKFIPVKEGEYFVSTIQVESLTADKLRWNMFSWFDNEDRYNFTYRQDRTGLTFDVDFEENEI